jgi:quinol monooxygenase YgiN
MYLSRIAFQVKGDQVDKFTATVLRTTEAALAMPGCQTFMMLVSPYDRSQYVLYEEWDTVEQADSFKRSDIRNESVAKVASVLKATPKVVEFDAQKRS